MLIVIIRPDKLEKTLKTAIDLEESSSDDEELSSEFNFSKDLVIIDMQMSRIGSPASDLLYCLGSSTSLDSRKVYLEEWLKLYHKTLIDDLVKFGYSENTFSLENLHEEINHLWHFALEAGIFHAEVYKKCLLHIFKRYAI